MCLWRFNFSLVQGPVEPRAAHCWHHAINSHPYYGNFLPTEHRHIQPYPDRFRNDFQLHNPNITRLLSVQFLLCFSALRNFWEFSRIQIWVKFACLFNSREHNRLHFLFVVKGTIASISFFIATLFATKFAFYAFRYKTSLLSFIENSFEITSI